MNASVKIQVPKINAITRSRIKPKQRLPRVRMLTKLVPLISVRFADSFWMVTEKKYNIDQIL